MKLDNLIYAGLALFAGFVVTLQGGINTRLGFNLKSGDWATFVTFFLGSIILAIYLLITKQSVPSIELFKTSPWWTYLGALSGVIYVTILIIIVPKLGVGTATILLLFAQIITSMVIDHFDVFALGQRSIDIYRVIGVVLVVAGVVLINKKL